MKLSKIMMFGCCVLMACAGSEKEQKKETPALSYDSQNLLNSLKNKEAYNEFYESESYGTEETPRNSYTVEAASTGGSRDKIAKSVDYYNADSAEYVRLASHINYIMYSMSKIQSAKNKIAVETELSDILKSIDPTELKNDELIETYTFFMEKTINDMKLIDSEKDRVMKKIAQKRKGAKYDAFSGLGQSAISVAISATGTGPMAPYALVGSILTSTINCGLNYARTINQLDGEKLDAQLKFDEDQEKAIDYARANLFTQTAKIFKHVEYNGKQIIDEADMSTFASQIAEIEAETDVEKRRELSNKYFKYFFEDKIVERKFKNFLPYWEAQIKISSYLYAHSKKQNDKQGMKKAYDFAFVCYNNLMRLSNGSFKNFYTKNPYLREASKVLLPMEIEQNRHADRINLLLSSIEENSDDMERLKEFPLLQFSAYYALGDMDRAEKAHKELIRNGEIKFFDPIDNLFVLSNKRSSDVDRHLAEMKQIYYAIVDNIGWWGEGGQSFGIKLNGSIFNGTSVRIYFKCVDKEQSMSFNKIASHFGSNTIEEQRKKCKAEDNFIEQSIWNDKDNPETFVKVDKKELPYSDDVIRFPNRIELVKDGYNLLIDLGDRGYKVESYFIANANGFFKFDERGQYEFVKWEE